MMHGFSMYYFKGIVVSLTSCLELIYTGRFTAVSYRHKKESSHCSIEDHFLKNKRDVDR